MPLHSPSTACDTLHLEQDNMALLPHITIDIAKIHHDPPPPNQKEEFWGKGGNFLEQVVKKPVEQLLPKHCSMQ